MNWEFFMGPVVGGIIGYITNGIAIKMLFRPLKPVYLFGMKLPFTPGLIPKEKGRIARSIGNVVARELINEEVLSKVLLQENIYEHINEKIDAVIESYLTNEQKIGEFASDLIGAERKEQLVTQIEDTLADKIYIKLVEMNIGQIAVENLIKSFRNGLDKSMFGAFALFVNDSMIESIAGKLEPVVNQMIENEGDALLKREIGKEREVLLDKPVMEAAAKVKEQADLIKEIVKKSYTHFVKHNLAHALEIIDLTKVVEERVNAFDTLEFERIILEIMSKELNAIIWLGALLGAIMGCFMGI